MIRRLALVGLSLALLVGFVSSARGQLISLDGNWVPERGIMHGEAVPANTLKAMTLVVSSGTFKATSGSMSSTGRMNQTGYLANQCDFTIETGSDQGRLIKVLFKVENQTLTITFSETSEFPSTHDSTADNKYLTMIYKKQGIAGSTPPLPAPASGSSGVGSSVVD